MPKGIQHLVSAAEVINFYALSTSACNKHLTPLAKVRHLQRLAMSAYVQANVKWLAHLSMWHQALHVKIEGFRVRRLCMVDRLYAYSILLLYYYNNAL